MITYKKITPIKIGGSGYGNVYRFEVTQDNLVTLSASERDVAYSFKLAGLSLPDELKGPYDIYGNKV